ncbi:DUF1553 domain-containing protein [Blastopirellula sp. J2-11]|uniref:DUF1553 domain-containing protein n=1 Tax=Blastopirellula sp. J2-11 TaxID=2943192 RepID=UPI0021CA7BC0|nr:DUF1553 domain-containing protein [Blastopirellula sp. J2-11]UUO07731.1 DUF1553 domain-containing protein [Blastopirellula sp. J2-11]
MNFALNHAARMRTLLIGWSLLATAAPGYAESPDPASLMRPLAQWQFDETADDVCHDRGDGELHGRYFAGAKRFAHATSGRESIVEFGPELTQARIEIAVNGAAQQTLQKLLAGSFSWEAWILDAAPAPDGRTNYAILYYADHRGFVANSTWFYRARQNGGYYFRMTDAQSRQAGIEIAPLTKTGAGDGQWHHYVISVDRSAENSDQWGIRAFRDGELVAEQPLRSDLGPIEHDGPLVLGNDHRAASPWRGAIDDLALFNVALDLQEVRRRYKATKADDESLKASQLALLTQREEFFENKIRPLFLESCVGCHTGDEFGESPLAFTSRAALLRGAEFGPAITPGKASESLLIQAVQWNHKALKMPPDESDRLTKRQIEDLRRWIDDGAFWPQSEEMPDDAANSETIEEQVESDHWAFQPRLHPTASKIDQPEWNEHEIDRFVFAKLQEQDISPNDLADKRTLIRRVTFDLTGLPPTPEEIDAFLNDRSTDAFAKVVDRLLASPRYGERWGRHWLDLARYADTQGDVGDFPIPTAYLYRDWVIDALNADMPYDRFIQAQLAGDLLAYEAPQQEDAAGLMAATGFIALSRRFGNTKFEDKHLMIEDTLDTLGRSVLGITLRCARCHDHRFDPLLQSDYYGLYGMFESTRYPTMGASNEKSPSALTPVVPDHEQQALLDEHFETIERYSYQINNRGRAWLKPTLQEFKDVSNQLKADDLSAEQRAQLSDRREKALSAYDGKFRELMLHGLDWINREKNRLADNPPAQAIFAVSEAEPHDAKIHLRGNPENLGRVVPRRFPLILSQGELPQRQGSGRLELARWITAPDHPLTARVIVNRVWRHYMGRGLVASTSNFGVRGAKPSHPELLDYLANTFVEEDGWSLKALHRRILLSRTYRLSAHATTESLRQDPDNVYLGRFSRRRLEAEAIRDAMLSISGNLDLSRSGEHPFPHWKKRSFSLNNPFKAEFPSNRRTIYLMTQRLFRQPFFSLFDGPDRNQSTEERTVSALPTQVLYLLNSPFVQQQAKAFADRVIAESEEDAAAVKLAYELAYGRAPTSVEQQAILEAKASLTLQIDDADAKPAEVRRVVWTAVAKSLFASNEFMHVE